MGREVAGGATQHCIDCATTQQHRGDQRWVCAHGFTGERLRHAAAPNQAVILAPGFLVAGIVFKAHDLAIHSRREPQTQAPDSFVNYVLTPNEHRSCEVLIDNDLRRAQYPIVLTLRENYALLSRFRCGKHRLHAGAGLVHETRHSLAVGFENPRAVGWRRRCP